MNCIPTVPEPPLQSWNPGISSGHVGRLVGLLNGHQTRGWRCIRHHLCSLFSLKQRQRPQFPAQMSLWGIQHPLMLQGPKKATRDSVLSLHGSAPGRHRRKTHGTSVPCVLQGKSQACSWAGFSFVLSQFYHLTWV